MHELSRRNVVVGAAWSVPIVAVAIATPLAAASGAFVISGAFSDWTRMNGQFRGSFVVTTLGGPAPTSGVTVAIVKNGSGVTVTPPTGWVQIPTSDEVVYFAAPSPIASPFTYTFEYAVDEIYYNFGGSQNLDAYVDTDDGSQLSSVQFEVGLRGYWGPVTSSGGSLFATYFVEDLTGGGVPPNDLDLTFDLPASLSISYTTGHGIELGTADPGARVLQHLSNDARFDYAGYVDVQIDAGTVSADQIIARIMRADGTDFIFDTLYVDAATTAPDLTPAWSAVTPFPNPYEPESPIEYRVSTISIPSSSTPPFASLIVELTVPIDAASSTYSTIGIDWRSIRTYDVGDGSYQVAYLYVGDYTAVPSVLWGVSEEVDPSIGWVLARVTLSGRLIGEYPIQLT